MRSQRGNHNFVDQDLILVCLAAQEKDSFIRIRIEGVAENTV